MKKSEKAIRLVGYYSILLGVSVIALWIQILLNESIPEGKIEISFHLFSEFLMALLCLLSGFLLINDKPKGRLTNSAAHATVIYSLINAMGYYAERDAKIMLVFFVFLTVISLIILIFHFSQPNKYYNKQIDS